MGAVATNRRSERIGSRYLVYDSIATGGMASVRIGRLVGANGFARIVAVKQLHRHLATKPSFVAMMRAEAQLLARIRHPNVVAPHDVVEKDGEFFIVMEFVNGLSINRILKSQPDRRVAPQVAGAIMVQALLGLHAAHEAVDERGNAMNIVHRDVSPQNILVGSDGIIRLVDFGIAKSVTSVPTMRGTIRAKPGYLAPEQLTGQRADRRVDVFTAGVVLWEMLTGERLFKGKNPADFIGALEKHEFRPPSDLNPGVRPLLDAVVETALRGAPEERFETTLAMAEAIRQSVTLVSQMELANWVSETCGPALAHLAERVREIESKSVTDVMICAARPTGSFPTPLGTGQGEPRPAMGLGASQSSPMNGRGAVARTRLRRTIGVIISSLCLGGAGVALAEWRSARTVPEPAVLIRALEPIAKVRPVSLPTIEVSPSNGPAAEPPSAPNQAAGAAGTVSSGPQRERPHARRHFRARRSAAKQDRASSAAAIDAWDWDAFGGRR